MKTVIEMAREAGMLVPGHRTDIEELERFAELVRADAIAAEREACAQTCLSVASGHPTVIREALKCCEVIRSRSNT